jgi:hypothetical protein
VTSSAYYRRNSQAVEHLTNAGFHGTQTEGLGGGYEGVGVPLEGGYRLSIAQDVDGDMSWNARVEDHNHDPLTGIDHGQNHDIELGQVHPKNLPDAVQGALRGPVLSHIREHMASQTVNRRQFG